MTLIDFTQLDRPPLTLTLEKELGRNYIVLDATDGETVYLRTPDLWLAIRFMRAMAAKKDAVVDERTIERLIDGTVGHSVRVPLVDAISSGEAELARTDGNQPLASPDSTRRLRLVV